MFEFSRELRRFFTSDGPKDGLTGGAQPLLELLDMGLLRAEARAADIAAGRISAKDPAQRSLEASRVWREVARRAGDAIALRKAASVADSAGARFREQGRMRDWAFARLEQALCAIDGAELFGDEGLAAAAEYALNEVREAKSGGVVSALALGSLVRLRGQAFLRAGDAPAVMSAAADFEEPLADLEASARGRGPCKLQSAALRCDKAELLLAAGSRLRDVDLLSAAASELEVVLARLDGAYEPLTWGRAQELKGAALVALGECRGELDVLADGVDAYADAIDMVGPQHSPMDFARLQHGLGLALRALGDASDNPRAYDQALDCFDRALATIRNVPVSLRAVAGSNRAACLARRAELLGDVKSLEEATDALKAELAALSPGRDPVAWAVAQVNLARLYETRIALRAERGGEATAAAFALNAALEVFAEHGLRTLSDQTARALARLAERNRSEA